MKQVPEGANCVIQFLDDATSRCNVYISFGSYLEQDNEDSFGIDDDDIFYYAADEEELKALMTPGSANDFIVLSYELTGG